MVQLTPPITVKGRFPNYWKSLSAVVQLTPLITVKGRFPHLLEELISCGAAYAGAVRFHVQLADPLQQKSVFSSIKKLILYFIFRVFFENASLFDYTYLQSSTIMENLFDLKT